MLMVSSVIFGCRLVSSRHSGVTTKPLEPHAQLEGENNLICSAQAVFSGTITELLEVFDQFERAFKLEPPRLFAGAWVRMLERGVPGLPPRSGLDEQSVFDLAACSVNHDAL
jgi:hypothetical protein